MYWTGDSGWAWVVMAGFMATFWILVAVVVVAVVRAIGRSSGGHRSAEEILAERYARGELDEAEYTRRLDTLRTSR